MDGSLHVETSARQALAQPQPDLVLLTTDAGTGTVTGAIALGAEWEQLLCELVLDAGRQAAGPGA